MINKNQFKTVNNKKILHKVGKQWKVFSIAFLLALGATGAVATANAGTNVSANAVHNPTANKTVKGKPKTRVAKLGSFRGRRRTTKARKFRAKTTKRNKGRKALKNKKNTRKSYRTFNTPQHKSKILTEDLTNWAKSRGFNRAQTAAILGNAKVESNMGNLEPGANFGDFLSTGLGMRTHDQETVNKYMDTFVKNEMRPWKTFKSMKHTSPYKLGNYFGSHIEEAYSNLGRGSASANMYKSLGNNFNDNNSVNTAAKKLPTSNASNTSANSNQLGQSVSTEHIDWNSLSPKVQSMYLSLTAAPKIQTVSGVSKANVDNDAPVYFADGAVRTVMDNMPSNANNNSANVQTASKKLSNSPLALQNNNNGATLVAKGQSQNNQNSNVTTAAKKTPTNKAQAKIANNGAATVLNTTNQKSSKAKIAKKAPGMLSQGSSASAKKNKQGTLAQQKSSVQTAAKKVSSVKAPSASSSVNKAQAKVVEIPQAKTANNKRTAAKKPGYVLTAGDHSTNEGSTQTTPTSAVTINLSQNLDGSKGIQNKVNSVVNAYQAKAATKSNADVNDLQKKMGSVAKDENAHIAQVPQQNANKANGFTQLASTVSQNKAGFAKTLLKAPQAHVVNMSNAQASETAKSLKNNNSLDNAISKFTNNSGATQSQSASSDNQQNQSQSNPFLDPNNSVNTGTARDKKQTNKIKNNYQAGVKAAQRDAANANKQGNVNFK